MPLSLKTPLCTALNPAYLPGNTESSLPSLRIIPPFAPFGGDGGKLTIWSSWYHLFQMGKMVESPSRGAARGSPFFWRRRETRPHLPIIGVITSRGVCARIAVVYCSSTGDFYREPRAASRVSASIRRRSRSRTAVDGVRESFHWHSGMIPWRSEERFLMGRVGTLKFFAIGACASATGGSDGNTRGVHRAPASPPFLAGSNLVSRNKIARIGACQ
jgi:hypothetical protein